jgi:hypothetical protein
MLLDRCPLLEVLGGVSLSVHNEIDSHPREPAASILQVLLYMCPHTTVYVSSCYCILSYDTNIYSRLENSYPCEPAASILQVIVSVS